jgi:carbamoyltransferase
LADPREAGTKDRVNRLVKERESYRPFAPALLSEAMSEYFVGIEKSPYMLVAGAVRPEKRSQLGAVTHADGTARPQSVDRVTNPRFHRLLEAFRARTGVPVLLNTSFNVAGEPIVLTPSDAVRCFFASGLDALVVGDCLLEKQGASVVH